MQAQPVESPGVAATGVARISLDEPLRPLSLGGSAQVLVVVTARGAVMGETTVSSEGELPVELQREAIRRACGERLGARELAAAFLRSARGAEPDAPMPAASVIVVRAAHSADLRACLESLAVLRTAPSEVLVCEGTASAKERDACRDFGAEPIDGGVGSALLRASGELIAVTDDATLADQGWLDELGVLFDDDPLQIAVTGYVGPLELRSRAQWRAHLALVPESFERTSYTCFVPRIPPLRPGNVILSRELLDESGLPEGLGGGAQALERGGRELAAAFLHAGYRVLFDPGRITWRRHPTSSAPLARRRRSRRGRPLRPPRPRAAARGRLGRVAVAERAPLTVTVISHNRRDRLAQVLDALARQTFPAEMLETVVVLDGSTDGSAERVRGLDLPFSLRLIEQDNRGPAASRNRAVSEASAPIVVTLDDDIVPEQGFVAAHAEAHRRAAGPHVALGHCPLAMPIDDLASLSGMQWYASFYSRRSETNHIWNYTDFGEGNASLPRSTVLEAGGWDERFPDNQDWELGLRLLGRGVTFGDYPEAVGLHYNEVDLASMLRKERVHGGADVALAHKHPQLLSHLQLAYFAGGGRAARMLALVYGRPRTSERLVRPARSLAALFERARQPYLWSRTLGALFLLAYAMGVRDRVPTLEQFEELVAPIRRGEGRDSIEVPLGRPGRLGVPPTAGQVDLVLAYGEEQIARVAAPAPRQQWDWNAVAQKVAGEAREPFEEALRRRPGELTELAPGVREVLAA